MTSRGFTLLETIVVMLVLGVIASLAVPRVLPAVHRTELTGTASTVAAFLVRARTHAISSKRCVRVRIDSVAIPFRLVLEELNAFDCDVSPETAPHIDGTPPGPAGLWIERARYNEPVEKISGNLSPGRAPVDDPALNTALSVVPDRGIWFRPTGRVWSLDNNVANDDSVIRLSHALLTPPGNEIEIIVNGMGPVEICRRGATVSGAPGSGSYQCQ